MKKLLALVLLLVAIPASAFWHGTAGTGGQGGGPNLATANIFSPPFGAPASQRTLTQPAASAADYVHEDGAFYNGMPFDLDAMGTWGQNIHATKGMRYVWIIGSDHPGCAGAFPLLCWGNDASYGMSGYSNDPLIPPDPSTMRPILPPAASLATIPGVGSMYSFMVAWPMYNADDVTNHLYVYTECIDQSGGASNNAIEMCLWVGNDFDTPLTAVGVSHPATNTGCPGACGFTSFQSVYKTSASTCVSYGGNDATAGAAGRWTSTDNCQTFTRAATINGAETCPGGGICTYSQTSTQKFTVGAQAYVIGREDARTVPQGGPGGDGGMYVTMAPIDANGNIVASPAVTRISAQYAGIFPGPTYLQSASTYVEDGVAVSFAVHGFFAGFPGCTHDAPYMGSPCPPGGGGLNQEYLDSYLYTVDATAAANAAPFGVQVSVASGTATISWKEPLGLPTHTYNIYRSTAVGTKGTLVTNTSGTSITDTPTASSSCTLYFYRVYKVDASSAEQGFRTVSTFVSSSSAFVNKHMTRSCVAGADFTTIDRTYLDTIDSTLTTQSLQTSLLFNTNTGYGVIKSGSNISRIMDLGTTRLPRGGDYTPQTPSKTTYGATACNGTVPGWINADTQSWGYYGGSAGNRLNQIRFKDGFTFIAAYSTTNNSTDTTLLAEGENGNGMSLQHIHGGTPQAQWNVNQLSQAPPAWSLADNKNLTGATTHIIGGTYDGTTATVYVEGVAGSGASPAQDTSPQIGQVNNPSNVYLLNSGSSRTVVATGGSTTKTYSFFSNESLYTGCDLWVFDKALTPTQMAAMTTMIRTRIGP